MRLAIASLCLAALVAIAALVGGDLDDTSARVAITAVAVSVYSILAMPGFAAYEDSGTRVLGAAGVGVSGLALILALVGIWQRDGGDHLEGWAVVSVLALALAHSTLLILGRRPQDSSAVRAVLGLTVVAIALVALVAWDLILSDGSSDAGIRILGIFAVLDVLGTAVLPIMRRLGGSSPSTVDSGRDASMGLLASSLGLDGAAALNGRAFSVSADELDDLVERGRGIGASVLVEPRSVSGGTLVAVLGDRDGNPLTLVAIPAPAD